MNGSLYIYTQVPYAVYTGLMAAPSKGTFFWDFIRRGTPYMYSKLRASSGTGDPGNVPGPSPNDVRVTSDFPLWYVGDTEVLAIPCTVTDMIDQGVIIADGRISKAEAWEGAGVIISPTVPADIKKTYDFTDPDLAPADATFKGTLAVNFLESLVPKTAHIAVTEGPGPNDVWVTSDFPLWYVGDTEVKAVPCNVTDMIDQGVIIADGRSISAEEAWEGAGVIISPAVPAGTKKTYDFTDPDLAPADATFKGTLEVDFSDSAVLKTAHITVTEAPSV